MGKNVAYAGLSTLQPAKSIGGLRPTGESSWVTHPSVIPPGTFAGYGARRPRDCWISAWLVAVEVIWGQLLDAITLGIIFARIAHPKNRARTVFISDCAVIARRDGALKFMFRVADVRSTQASSVPSLYKKTFLGSQTKSQRPCTGFLFSFPLFLLQVCSS